MLFRMTPLPPDPAHDVMAMRATVRVDRARLELRHGRSIAMRAADDGDWQLMTAIETLSEQRLQRAAGSPQAAPLQTMTCF